MVLYQKAGQIIQIKLYTEEENGLKKESETDKVWSTYINNKVRNILQQSSQY